ncbi:MAG: ATP-binding cassette domain-containing protein [Herpetosiphonaceae bacterium]|nr:ATP-binding cassette domain-containing protein [Herpetosiphonaceae bacterium]
MSMVAVEEVSKRFGSTLAVDNVSFAVEPGEIFGLLGPNGAGKTTTIRMILDIFKPDRGHIAVFGGPLTATARQHIGYLPEERGLYKHMPIGECLTYLATLKGLSKADAARRAAAYLERVGLSDVVKKKVNELSKGMQQKVQLGVALLHAPDLLIIDEPFYGLDPVNTRLVKEMLCDARDRGAAIIMSTHQMDRVEELCQRMCMFNQGHVVLYGDVSAIRHDFAPNAVIVAGSGPFATLPGVDRAEPTAQGIELWLDIATDPHTILRLIATRPEFTVDRFAIATPSLDDIFVAVVEGRTRIDRRSSVDATPVGAHLNA